MQYLGGKGKIAKQIAQVLKNLREPGQPYLEPFLGGASVFVEMEDCPGNSGPRIGSDIHQPLITMWNAVLSGWVPPDSLSEDEYRTLKENRNPENPLTAFAGFGCSFAGKYFGGYARGHVSASGTAKSVVRKAARMTHSVLFCNDYRDWYGAEDCLIYCDPPYATTTGYAGTDKFDHQEFWYWVRQMSKHNTVLVSEYTAPEDFTPVWSDTPTQGLRKGQNGDKVVTRPEKLFMLY